MDINGNNGPKLKINKYFSCDGCKWLGENDSWSIISRDVNVTESKFCLHPEMISKFIVINNKKTPSFCPLLLNKMRLEKIKELNNK